MRVAEISLLTKSQKSIIIYSRPSGTVAPYVAERYYGEESPGIVGQDNG